MSHSNKSDQINFRVSGASYDLIAKAAETHGVEVASFCRNAALSAAGSDLAPHETSLLKAFAGLVANLEGEIVKLRSDLTGTVNSTHLRSLAALEETLGLRVILTNAAEVISRGEKFRDGDMKALVATANASKAKAASRVLSALADRLNPSASAPVGVGSTPNEVANA